MLNAEKHTGIIMTLLMVISTRTRKYLERLIVGLRHQHNAERLCRVPLRLDHVIIQHGFLSQKGYHESLVLIGYARGDLNSDWLGQVADDDFGACLVIEVHADDG
jgi:hypothetical protein